MKIAHLINSLATGGAEKLVVETVPLYQQAGITTDVIVANGTNHPFTQQLHASSKTKIISLGLGSVYNPLLIFKLMRLLNNYDIIHVHLFPVQYFAVVAKWLCRAKVKLVFTEHNTTNRRIHKWYLKYLERKIYTTYSKVICITNEIKNIYEHYLPNFKDKWKVIHNGVNTTFIQNGIALDKNTIDNGIFSNDILIIQVAGFRMQKDQPTLIKAIQLLPPHFKLILVGEGVEREKCQQLVQQLKLSERVFFLGVRMDVPQLLKTADVVVLSSKYEGLSLSSIEGMASGKPFIASDVPGLSDVVSGAGVLFECGNEQELAAHIQTLINNSDYYQKIATACQQRAQEFTIEKMVTAHIEMYRKILNENQA
jgi:glycosyltransferase involved in cell wall biosynthesis